MGLVIGDDLMIDSIGFDLTESVNIDFGDYVRRRQSSLEKVSHNGVPNYAFSLDAQIRSKLSSIGPLRTVGQALSSATIPIKRQFLMMDGVAVGPKQFSEIYEMGEDCARTLGIGIPQIFVISDPDLNAWTYCTGTVDQLIVLTSGLVQSFNSQELKFIIGHECGHVHNQHMVYNTIWEMLTNPLAEKMLLGTLNLIPGTSSLLPLITTVAKTSLWYLFGRWHRCAEFTCDRAGLICCKDLNAALNALVRLHAGGVQAIRGFNYEEYARQIEKVNESPLCFLEVFRKHPLGPKRVEALRLFGKCETLSSWQVKIDNDSKQTSKIEVDRNCQALLS